MSIFPPKVNEKKKKKISLAVVDFYPKYMILLEDSIAILHDPLSFEPILCSSRMVFYAYLISILISILYS